MKLKDFKVDGRYLDLLSYFISIADLKITYIIIPLIISLTVTFSLHSKNSLELSFLIGTLALMLGCIFTFIIGLKEKIKNNNLIIKKIHIKNKIKMSIIVMSITFIEIVALSIITSYIK